MLTKKNVQVARDAVEVAVECAIEGTPFTLEKQECRASYDRAGHVKITVVLTTAEWREQQAKVAASDAGLLGLPDDAVGRTFTSRGERYRVVGIKIRNRKYPVLAERLKDGATYKFGEAIVARLLEAEKAA
jgi:hypothetical protein